jgi:hypothetical protein
MSDKESAILLAEEEAKVGKLQEFCGEEVGQRPEKNERNGSCNADGDRLPHWVNELQAAK